ncbi:MAG: Alkaline ceramidase domain protein [Devosia sp.]|nr:Alkaline ceramidase domain protein [Devosia sp.]
MGTLRGGVAVVDITPAPGLLLSGFAARTEPCIGIHDRLTVRAIVLGDTAIVVADVIGFHEEMSARIRERCSMPVANIIVAATHTHGAPACMEHRLGSADPGFLQQLEDGCVAALQQALANAEPVSLTAGMGADPEVARNRRHDDGPLDTSLPVLRLRAIDGRLIATLVSYACHPTVLGADNRLITGDFPHYVRAHIEAAHPGSVAVFLNGCTGDVNIGHTAQASVSLAANNARTFENAERLGTRIAEAALAAPGRQIGDTVSARENWVELALERREGDLSAIAAQWQHEAQTADPLRRILLDHWIAWAQANQSLPPSYWTGRVSLLDWGGVPIVALPGEIFADTGLSIRAASGNGPAFVISYADGTPGYIPPASEYAFGGYEVDEAHRFVGMRGSFVSGSAERLANSAKALISLHEKTAR